jgi:hypothetical protein
MLSTFTYPAEVFFLQSLINASIAYNVSRYWYQWSPLWYWSC